MDNALKGLLSGGGGGLLVPRMKKFVFEERLALLADPSLEKVKVLEECRLATEYYKERIAQFKLSAGRDRMAKKYHPSGLHGCKRALIFKLGSAEKNQPYDRDGEYRSQMIFSNGDFVHLRLQILLHRMGLLNQWEVPLDDAKLNMEGHCDGIITVAGVKYILEIKSINERGFGDVQRGPKEDHVWQVNCYMRMSGIHKAVILYENKNRQEPHEHVVDMSKVIQQDIETQVSVAELCRKGCKLPPRAGDSPRSDACKWCEYTGVCWAASKSLAFEKSLKQKGSKHEDKTAPETKVVHGTGRRLVIVRKPVAAVAGKSEERPHGTSIRRFLSVR